MAGAYGSAQAARDALGGRWAALAVAPPPPGEQLAILAARFPPLRPLLPAALAMLRLARLASGQAGSKPILASVGPVLAGAGSGRAGTAQFGVGDSRDTEDAQDVTAGEAGDAGELRAWEGTAEAAARAGGVRTGDPGLHVGRHFSLRDLIKWCRRMQARWRGLGGAGRCAAVQDADRVSKLP